MTPSDIISRNRLADAVCHSEQMDIWAGELLFAMSDWVVAPQNYDETIDLNRVAKLAIRDLVEKAFSHPELLGLPTKPPYRKQER